jgi:hypothetical protein
MPNIVISDQFYQAAFEDPSIVSMHDTRSFFTPENLRAWQEKASKPDYDFSKLSVQEMYFAVASGFLSDSVRLPKILEAARRLIENPHNDQDLSIPKPILGALKDDYRRSLEIKLQKAKGRMLRYNRAMAVSLSSPDSSYRQELNTSFQRQLEIDRNSSPK